MTNPNPYRIKGPACISFSGGRTSAYMLERIVEAHGGTLPDDVFICFANTGREREATLRFVHECESRFGVRIHWLEFVDERKGTPVDERFEIVGYNSASRNGEPLMRLIRRKKALFSTLRGRWCTEFAKVGVIANFMLSRGYAEGEYLEVIGFRADEYDRVVELPARERNAGRRFSFPLNDAGVRKADVLRHWQSSPFDLELRRGTGNCDHCPFVSEKARIARARLMPDGLGWWGGLEVEFGFAFGRLSIEEIRQRVHENPVLALNDIEEDAADSECSGWCGA